MYRKITSITAALVLCLGTAVLAENYERAEVSLIPAQQQVVLPDGKEITTSCTLLKHIVDDTVLGYNSGYETGQRTVMYFDPAECDSPTYPFEITGLSFTLLDPPDAYDPRIYKWPVELDVVVYELYSAADSCLGPGTEICRVPVVCDSAGFAYPATGTVTFSTPCCVDGPFFIGVEYTDTYTGSLPSVMYDFSSEPDLCHLFMFVCDSIWAGWYAYWVTPPGYPFYWVHGETVSLNCCEDADGDEVCDVIDNCPGVYNPGQDDNDSDGTGDLCDICPGYDDSLDDDGDGVPDGCDACPGYDDGLDDDSDGVPDGCDVCPGYDDNIDNDGDNVPDGCDNCPTDHNPYQIDTDHDGLGNTCDDDDDDDLVPDISDNCPLVYNPGQEDSNSDGIGDACSCLGTTGNVDCDPSEMVDMGDLTVLIDHLFISLAPLCSETEANIDVSGIVDMGDLTMLIDHLFISLDPLPPCP